MGLTSESVFVANQNMQATRYGRLCITLICTRVGAESTYFGMYPGLCARAMKPDTFQTFLQELELDVRAWHWSKALSETRNSKCLYS